MQQTISNAHPILDVDAVFASFFLTEPNRHSPVEPAAFLNCPNRLRLRELNHDDYARRDVKPVETVVFAVTTAAFVVIIFVYALGQPMPVWWGR